MAVFASLRLLFWPVLRMFEAMAESQLVSEAEPVFEHDARQVIARLKRALVAVVDSVPMKPERAANLASALGIDTKLAWKIGRVISDADPFTAALYVPGPAGLKIFLRAARRRNVSKGLIASAEAAFGRFSALVHTHAGSRKAFDMMLAAHAQQDRLRADLEHRRQMFEGSSYVWGVQARVKLRLDVVAPAADPMMYDVATIRGFVDLRRLRPDVPWRISRGYSADEAGETHVDQARTPLAATAPGGMNGLPLLEDFCSKPLPKCRRVEAPQGVIEYELVEGAVGNTGIITCVIGELIRGVEPRYRTEQYRDFSQGIHLRTPSELLVFDVLIHREVLGRPIEPRLVAYSDLFSDRIAPRYRTCDALPVNERVEHLGTGLDAVDLVENPRYAELVQFTLDRAGWDAEEFDVFRVRMAYPPIPATLMITHELPDRPDE